MIQTHAHLPMKSGLTSSRHMIIDAAYKQSQKTSISIHIDVRVLDEFKATGEGWQTRMNFALAEWAEQHGVLEHSPN
jgi:uncharacterized protein (DUF4415 family)